MGNILIDIVVERERKKAKRSYDSYFRYNEEIIYDSDYFQRTAFLHAGKIVRSEMFAMLRETKDIIAGKGFSFERLEYLQRTAKFIE